MATRWGTGFPSGPNHTPFVRIFRFFRFSKPRTMASRWALKWQSLHSHWSFSGLRATSASWMFWGVRKVVWWSPSPGASPQPSHMPPSIWRRREM